MCYLYAHDAHREYYIIMYTDNNKKVYPLRLICRDNMCFVDHMLYACHGITVSATEQAVHAAVCVVDACLLFYFFYSCDFAVLAFPRLFLLIEGTLMMKL